MINPKIFTQQNNIFMNRLNQICLPYSDNALFYKVLDTTIMSGKTVKISFEEEKMKEDSGLQKRITNCANGREFFEQMSDFWRTTKDAIKHIANRNIFGMWELCKDQTLKLMYRAYQVEICFENKTGEYFLRLVPVGKGTKSRAWMYIA